jgi:phosphoribosyl 1,2-cyclic phosphodiesterase
MQMIALQSGSNGNCIYVEANGIRLLFDAGISGKQAEQRLAAHGRDIRDVDALIISHEHRDHSHAMGIFHRKFGLPVYVTRRTLAAAGARQRLGRIDHLRHYAAGTALQFGTVSVQTVCTPHDGDDPVAFVVDDGRHRLGILTDLGHAFRSLTDLIPTLDALLLESNYDPDMLATGFYPEPLKRRIRGQAGHLSNVEAAELLRNSMGRKLKWVCLGHLSGENNAPELAAETHRSIWGDRVPLLLAGRNGATDVIDV